MDSIQKKRPWWANLSVWVIAGALIGGMLGELTGSPEMADSPEGLYAAIIWLKGAFLFVLTMLIVPVVFFSLVSGLLSIGSVSRVPKLGGLTLAYYLVTTGIAIVIGLLAVLVYHPWADGEVLLDRTAVESYDRQEPSALIEGGGSSADGIVKKLASATFQTPWSAIRKRSILAIVMYALLTGVLLGILTSPASRIRTVFRHANSLMNRLLTLVIYTAPLGVLAISYDFAVKTSAALFTQLLSFGLLVLLATALHGLVVLPGLAWLFARIPPRTLFRKISTPMLIALSTASSAATLPVTLKTCRDELDIEDEVAGFVCPLGATMNMDGTALFEGIAAVFLAHLYGMELGTAGIVAIFIMAMVSSIGAPGMPSGSMSGMQMVLLSVGIPLEAIGILLVIERPLDTFRTAVNVEGDIIGAAIVNRYYAQNPKEPMNA